MAKVIPFQNQSIARRLIEKFGYTTDLPIDKFDMFIIDEGLATDPETDDTKDPKYKGFVQERNAAKRLINTAASVLNENAFSITVRDAGKTYRIVEWNQNTQNIAKDLGAKVQTYTDNRMTALKSLHNKTEKLALERHDDENLKETAQMLAFMRIQGVELQAKIKGLVAHYNAAADAVEDRVKAISQEYDTALELEQQG